jgi:hypothetical protein
VRGPVCWAKMVHFRKPWKHAFWPSPECREPFSMLPRHTLSGFMVWNAGDGPWWAATADVNPNPCNIHTGLKHLFQWDQLIVCQTHSKTCRTAPAVSLHSFIVYNYGNHRKNRFAPTWAVHFFQSFASFPAKKGVQNRTFTSDPRTFIKMSTILLQTPLVS